MKELIENKSAKTMDRINIIKKTIRRHKRNIKLLHSFKNYHNPNRFAPRHFKYNCLPASKSRYCDTLKNLTDQITDLEKELAVLVEYGA